jgi:3'(2'), 5'-bisphosphate nucleotidase
MAGWDALSMAHERIADAILPAVLAAARVQMLYFRSGAQVQTKADATPVTVADKDSEGILVAALGHILPSVPIVAEEAVAAGRVPVLGAGGGREFFLVDPLDGTREFIADRPEFTINIALVRDGVPRFGMIYAPALGVLYATLGHAYAVELSLAPDASAKRFADLRAKEIRSRAPPTDGLVAVASRSHGSVGTDAFLGQYKIARRMAAGSSLKFCEIAKGAADIYPRVGQTCEWDTAAGQAIICASGGSVTTLEGVPLVYGKAEQRFRNPDFVAWGRGPLPAQY